MPAAIWPLRRIKEAFRRGLGYHVDTIGEYIITAPGVLFKTEDHTEGAMTLLKNGR